MVRNGQYQDQHLGIVILIYDAVIANTDPPEITTTLLFPHAG